MKKVLITIVLAISFLFVACNNGSKSDNTGTKNPVQVEKNIGEKAKDKEQQPKGTNKYVVASNSKVTWIGSGPLDKNNGTLDITEGSLLVANGVIKSANFTINMRSVKVLNLNANGNESLAEHLRSSDFFFASKFPEASFEMTSIKEYVKNETDKLKIENPTHIVTGNLAIKKIPHSIEFPASIIIDDGKITAKASFNINRLKWNVLYGNDKLMGDMFISPTVNVGFDITAEKQ